MKISVVIPTFNRKHVLKRALDSVESQTKRPFEIIVIDDGSIDGTQEWMKEHYPSVKFIYQKNHGVSSARNRGIEISKGSWVAFLDSDDEWISEKLEQQEQLIMDNPGSMVCHANEIWIRNGVRVNQMKKHEKHGGDIFEKCLDICRISPSSVMIKKEVFDRIGLFDESLRVCEDYDLWLRITSKLPVLFLDVPLIIKHGGHPDQLSKVDDGIEQYRIRSLEKILGSSLLNESQSRCAREMLVHKLNIYANGLEKRDKLEELDLVDQKKEYWLQWKP